MKFVNPSCSYNKNCAGAGTKLKATSGWNSYSGITGTDNHGFSALPGGYGGSDGRFYGVGDGGLWWSSSENDSDGAYGWGMHYNNENAIYLNDSKSLLPSVRCLQD